MSIQIFGTKKCRNTSKAERFFKERGIKYQLVNLAEKGISKGELQSVLKVLGSDEVIDKNSREYIKKNLQYMKYDPVEEILESPLIINTPLVRCGRDASAGLAEEKWKKWASEIKGS